VAFQEEPELITQSVSWSLTHSVSQLLYHERSWFGTLLPPKIYSNVTDIFCVTQTICNTVFDICSKFLLLRLSGNWKKLPWQSRQQISPLCYCQCTKLQGITS